ncbi:MAG: diphosphomevalonate decarboxylase [Candidatus Gottesmanbacteria bacterium]|nr:diphosphomevalonate decarboxylase [Candidatus Gottesmanbacteria bacterium]
MMKATAEASANIAFIKYWGRKDARLRLPYNASISMNLSGCVTTTTVEFSRDYEQDIVAEGFDKKRIITHIDRLRKLAGIQQRVHMKTKNSFPTSAGIASSASGFAALTVAAAAALGLKLSEKELTNLSRLGSGSACRSIPDGFVKWEDSFAYSLYPPEYWDLRDVLVIVKQTQKHVSSSTGHDGAATSPDFGKRLETVSGRIVRIQEALRTKNFKAFGEVTEEDCLDMHHVMQTQSPPLFYWNNTTKRIMDAVTGWRAIGLPVYFTIDAGPNVHLICEGKDEKKVMKVLQSRIWLRQRIKEIIVNKPSKGARVV